MNDVLLWGFKIFGLLFLMIAFHEIGHLIYFATILKKRPKIRFVRHGLGFKFLVGTEFDYEGVTTKELKDLYLAGVIGGILPWFFIILITNGLLIYVMMILPYMWGSMRDVVRILEVDKECLKKKEE